MTKLTVAALAGILLGAACSNYIFVGSSLALIPWSVAGLALGAWCHGKRETLLTGAVYGFVLSFTFMVTGYRGHAPIVTRLGFFAILGAIGAVFGLLLAFVGSLVTPARKAESL